MDKIDLTKDLKELYGASAKAAAVVNVPPFDFPMIDGRGDPNKAPEYEQAVKILRFGPYDAEAPTIARLHAFIEAQGGAQRGKHHEIYLGDPRKTAAEKLKTILRQPMARKS